MRHATGGKLERLLLDLHEAPFAPDGWRAFLATVVRQLGATSASFVSGDVTRPQSALTVHSNVNPDFLRQYNEHYHALDIWGTLARQRGLFRAGVAGTSEELCSTDELARSPFGAELALPCGIVHGMTGIIAADGSRMAAISLYRDRRRQPFATAQVVLIRAMLPHLDSAIRSHARLESLKRFGKALEEAFDAMPTGVVLAAHDGTAVWLNRAAQAIVAAADGLRIERNKLKGTVCSENARLDHMIRSAPTGNSLPVQSAMTVTRHSSSRPYVVSVTPLNKAHATIDTSLLPPEAQVVVFIEDPSAASAIPMDLLRTLYGFTVAEARLAIMLISGASVSEAAERLQRSIHTVRTQLKMLMAKTQTRRQSELLRTLLAVRKTVR